MVPNFHLQNKVCLLRKLGSPEGGLNLFPMGVIILPYRGDSFVLYQTENIILSTLRSLSFVLKITKAIHLLVWAAVFDFLSAQCFTVFYRAFVSLAHSTK